MKIINEKKLNKTKNKIKCMNFYFVQKTKLLKKIINN